MLRKMVVGLLGLLLGTVALAANEPVTIDFWHAMSSGHQPNLQKLVDDFMAEYPYITVNLTYQGSYSALQGKINAAVAAGNLPTIAQVYENWVTLIQSLLYPIGPHMTAEEIADIIDGLVPSNTYNGVLTTVPFNKSIMVLYYNADLIPNPPTTWGVLRPREGAHRGSGRGWEDRSVRDGAAPSGEPRAVPGVPRPGRRLDPERRLDGGHAL